MRERRPGAFHAKETVRHGAEPNARFAVDGNVVYTAVDAKPKQSTALKRLANVAANPAVALLVDHYADDWDELWWVRADGTGRVIDPEDPEGVRALSLLADRYPRFAARGAVLAVDVRRWSGWASKARKASRPGPTQNITLASCRARALEGFRL